MRRRAAPLALVGLALLALLAVGLWRLWPAASPGPARASEIGGPFSLIDQTGAAVDERRLLGRWTAVYFGYTNCPDVCPTTLIALAQAIDALGADSRRMQVLFITVDPERDSPAQLGRYLANPAFPRGALGLTGAPARVAAAAKAYRVYYRKAGAGAGYSVDHTSVIYLMDPRGQFARPLPAGAAPADLAHQIEDAIRRG